MRIAKKNHKWIPGFHTTAAHLKVPAFKHHQNSTSRHRERERERKKKRAKMEAGKGKKKSEIIGGPVDGVRRRGSGGSRGELK